MLLWHRSSLASSGWEETPYLPASLQGQAGPSPVVLRKDSVYIALFICFSKGVTLPYALVSVSA